MIGEIGVNGAIGAIDLELCSSQGDPAYDLGVLLGHDVMWGLCTGSTAACLAALRSALDAYRGGAGGDVAWADMHARVRRSRALTMLDAIARERRIDVRAFEPRLVCAAASLLASGPDVATAVAQRFADAIVDAAVVACTGSPP